MANPTPSPTPPATPHPHSPFNQAQLAALNEADKITTAAQKPAYAAALALREITAAYVTQLVDDILACRKTGATATQSTTGKTVCGAPPSNWTTLASESWGCSDTASGLGEKKPLTRTWAKTCRT